MLAKCLVYASVVLCLVAASSAALAQEYSWQVSGAASHHELDIMDTDVDLYSINATHYFASVDAADGPYALVSFLHPTASMSASINRSTTTLQVLPIFAPNPGSQPVRAHKLTRHGTAYLLSGRYVWPGTKWYAGGSYSKGHGGNAALPFERSKTHSTGYSVTGGKYLGPHTSLDLSLGSSTQTTALNLRCPGICLFVPVSLDGQTDSVTVDVFHLAKIGSLAYSVEGRVSQADLSIDSTSLDYSGVFPFPSFGLPPFAPTEADAQVVHNRATQRVRTYSAAGELFPTRKLGFRLGYSHPEGDLAGGDAYDVAATWFFRPRIAVQFAIARVKQDNALLGDQHSDTSTLSILGRF